MNELLKLGMGLTCASFRMGSENLWGRFIFGIFANDVRTNKSTDLPTTEGIFTFTREPSLMDVTNVVIRIDPSTGSLYS